MIGKILSEDSLAILSYDDLKFLKYLIETLTVTHNLLQIPENPLIYKHAYFHLYLLKMIFLQHIARDIISGIIIVNIQRESR